MFTVGGRNVYPAEARGGAGRTSRHSVLLGRWRSRRRSGPGAARAGADATATLDEAAIIAFVGERVASYKVPRTVEFVDRPLRDDAGKARRTAVRDDVIARRQAQARR